MITAQRVTIINGSGSELITSGGYWEQEPVGIGIEVHGGILAGNGDSLSVMSDNDNSIYLRGEGTCNYNLM